MIHEDERRILEDWPEAKIITAKVDCELGNHYHKIKTERFVLVKGSARMHLNINDNGYTAERMLSGKLYTVEPGTKHTFFLDKGSVLVGICSHPFDPTDDYR